jgi:hypothetical protein
MTTVAIIAQAILFGPAMILGFLWKAAQAGFETGREIFDDLVE